MGQGRFADTQALSFKPPASTIQGMPKKNAGKRPPFYRRRFLIDTKFQLSIVGYFLSLFLFSIILLFYGIRRTLEMMDDQALRLDPRHTHLIELLRDERQNFLAEYFVFYSLSILIAGLAGGILVSHRVAGPLYRLRTILNDLGEGRQVNDIKFRKRDFLQDLLPALRKVAKKLSDAP
jgi:hypothetical protein